MHSRIFLELEVKISCLHSFLSQGTHSVSSSLGFSPARWWLSVHWVYWNLSLLKGSIKPAKQKQQPKDHRLTTTTIQIALYINILKKLYLSATIKSSRASPPVVVITFRTKKVTCFTNFCTTSTPVRRDGWAAIISHCCALDDSAQVYCQAAWNINGSAQFSSFLTITQIA